MVALLAGVLPAVPVSAATTSACPSGTFPSGQFFDVNGGVHADAIDCAAGWGIVAGVGNDRFRPDGNISRAQVATMLARVLDAADKRPARVPSQGFVDNSSGPHAANVDLLAHLGIVNGVGTGQFAPQRPVTRAQLASMIVRLHEEVFNGEFPAGRSSFRDTSGVHAANIDKLAAAGIVAGRNVNTFDPASSVTRAQMATFSMRYVSVLVAEGDVKPPKVPTTPTGPMPAFCNQIGANFYSGYAHFRVDTQVSRASGSPAGCVWKHVNFTGGDESCGPNDGVQFIIRKDSGVSYRVPSGATVVPGLPTGEAGYITGSRGNAHAVIRTHDATWRAQAVAPAGTYLPDGYDSLNMLMDGLERLGY